MLGINYWVWNTWINGQQKGNGHQNTERIGRTGTMVCQTSEGYYSGMHIWWDRAYYMQGGSLRTGFAKHIGVPREPIDVRCGSVQEVPQHALSVVDSPQICPVHAWWTLHWMPKVRANMYRHTVLCKEGDWDTLRDGNSCTNILNTTRPIMLCKYAQIPVQCEHVSGHLMLCKCEGMMPYERRPGLLCTRASPNTPLLCD